MIFDELENINKLSVPVAKKAALDWIVKNIPDIIKLNKNIEIVTLNDDEWLDVNKPDYVNFVIYNFNILMLSRRKLNEEGMGRYLIYHPKKPNKTVTLKLSHML